MCACHDAMRTLVTRPALKEKALYKMRAFFGVQREKKKVKYSKKHSIIRYQDKT
jgi:hypothetical protein